MHTARRPIRVLIVDDEKKACTNLRNILRDFIEDEVEVVGMASSTKEAEQMIASLQPDAVFQDIEMPHENAFQFLDRISPVIFEVIFVTAYDEYAVKAFRLNAVDYILKPVSISELRAAIEKLADRIRFKRAIAHENTSYRELEDHIAGRVKQDRITLRDSGKMEVVEFRHLCFIEAQSSYSRIVYSKNGELREIVMSNPLSDYEEMLPEDLFFRIHRSYLLNCSFVKKVLSDSSNQVLLKGNITLPVSRRRYNEFLEFLKNNEYYYE